MSTSEPGGPRPAPPDRSQWAPPVEGPPPPAPSVAPPTPGGQWAPPHAEKLRVTLIQVTSFVLMTQRRARTCTGTLAECQAFARKVMIHNLLLGWWGIPFGLVWTPMALSKNAKTLGKLRQISGGVAGAGWYPDPSGRHTSRMWNGQAWTDQVRDTGTDAV
jgi:hypothetical protein